MNQLRVLIAMSQIKKKNQIIVNTKKMYLINAQLYIIKH
jgi:hypothetical protein